MDFGETAARRSFCLFVSAHVCDGDLSSGWIKRVCAGQARGSSDNQPDHATNQGDGCKDQHYPQIDERSTGPIQHVAGNILSPSLSLGRHGIVHGKRIHQSRFREPTGIVSRWGKGVEALPLELSANPGSERRRPLGPSSGHRFILRT
jgi:hypothetical protein